MIPQADGLSSRSVGFESTHPGTLVGSHSCALCVVFDAEGSWQGNLSPP